MTSVPHCVGLINVHKPVGMTSRRVVDVVARAAGTRRVGHAGTLDPLASGVLVVCIGWATRLVPFVQERPKRYRAEFLLGRTSDTDDVTGTVVEKTPAAIPSRDQTEAALAPFVGRIAQIPPQFSAVHVDGERAYRRARQGESVEIAPREVDVYSIELLDYAWPGLVLSIECGSGTYIRSIGRDLGNALGCGAVMSSLVREAIGDFTLQSAVPLANLTSATLPGHLLPPLEAVRHLPRCEVSEMELRQLALGRALSVDREFPAGKPVAITGSAGELLALGEYVPDRRVIQPRQVFARE